MNKLNQKQSRKLKKGKKMEHKKIEDIKDAFIGKTFNIWYDKNGYYFNMYANGVTIYIPHEEWNDFIEDIENLSEI